jgi:hypothetical protein
VHGWRRLHRGVVLAWLCALPYASAEEAKPPEGAAPPGDSAPAGQRAPTGNPSGGARPETSREQMERFKREKGAGSDHPFEGFAAEAEREMQRLREAAIGGSPGATRGEEERRQGASDEKYRALEREILDERLAGLASWGTSGCFLEEPDWNEQDDFIRHRELTRDDFLSNSAQKIALAVKVPGARVGAYVALRLSCVVKTRLTGLGDDRHRAEISQVRYFALLSRNESYWSPEADREGSYLLGHEQLHFDIAEAFARHLTSLEHRIRRHVSSSGETPEEAIGRLQLSWGQHMRLTQTDFEKIEVEYDRETKHGSLPERQTEWFWRAQDDFEAISKGMRLESLRALR